MDLSFARLEADATVVAMPAELAVLMVGIAARQAASPTARAFATIGGQDARQGLQGHAGSFHADAAKSLSGIVNWPFTEPV